MQRINISKAGYVDKDAYARDLHRSGGPGLVELDGLIGSGDNNALLRAIWGPSLASFGQAVANELVSEQAERPHVFVKKLRARR